MALLILLIEPPTGAAQGHVPVEVAVVVKDVQGVEAVLGEKPFHLGGGGPPVVVVALEEELPPPGQGVQPGKVRLGLLQAHAPGDVPAQDHRVLLPHRRKTGGELFHISLPGTAEDIHGLVRPQGEMGVAQGE